MNAVNSDLRIDRRVPMPALLAEAFESFRTALNAAQLPGLRPSHYRVMSLIPQEGLQLSDLARLAAITKAGTGQFIAHLRREGYVLVDRNPADQRAKIVTLTPLGAAAVRVSQNIIADTERLWAETLGADRYAELRLALTEVAALSEHEPG
ncbi:hypothetical protein AAGW05_12900 [Arthrobacter sp. LAPM80]|uniref:MarR family winged helix-turn-helix transcriptional regulator n=1 Tax=Arthrobacter sp. LAPM80 TaxID=3141788 RepID=UPI00398B2FD6